MHQRFKMTKTGCPQPASAPANMSTDRLPRKKAFSTLVAHGHCSAASIIPSRFLSHRPSPWFGSTPMNGPPPQNVQAGYMMSQNGPPTGVPVTDLTWSMPSGLEKEKSGSAVGVQSFFLSSGPMQTPKPVGLAACGCVNSVMQGVVALQHNHTGCGGVRHLWFVVDVHHKLDVWHRRPALPTLSRRRCPLVLSATQRSCQGHACGTAQQPPALWQESCPSYLGTEAMRCQMWWHLFEKLEEGVLDALAARMKRKPAGAGRAAFRPVELALDDLRNTQVPYSRRRVPFGPGIRVRAMHCAGLCGGADLVVVHPAHPLSAARVDHVVCPRLIEDLPADPARPQHRV